MTKTHSAPAPTPEPEAPQIARAEFVTKKHKRFGELQTLKRGDGRHQVVGPPRDDGNNLEGRIFEELDD